MKSLLNIEQIRHRIAQLRKKRRQILEEIVSHWRCLTESTAEAVASIAELQRCDALGATDDLKMNLPPLNLENQSSTEDKAELELSLLSSPWLDSATEALLRLYSHLPGYVDHVAQLRDLELQLTRFRRQLKFRLKDQQPAVHLLLDKEDELFYRRRESREL